eukprot:7821384-Pyramimonas_sp.AAC.1
MAGKKMRAKVLTATNCRAMRKPLTLILSFREFISALNENDSGSRFCNFLTQRRHMLTPAMDGGLLNSRSTKSANYAIILKRNDPGCEDPQPMPERGGGTDVNSCEITLLREILDVQGLQRLQKNEQGDLTDDTAQLHRPALQTSVRQPQDTTPGV